MYSFSEKRKKQSKLSLLQYLTLKANSTCISSSCRERFASIWNDKMYLNKKHNIKVLQPGTSINMYKWGPSFKNVLTNRFLNDYTEKKKIQI